MCTIHNVRKLNDHREFEDIGTTQKTHNPFTVLTHEIQEARSLHHSHASEPTGSSYLVFSHLETDHSDELSSEHIPTFTITISE